MNSSSTVVNIGDASSLDVKLYYSGYFLLLNENNFYVTITGVNGWGDGNAVGIYQSKSCTAALTKLYNSTTGILTISGNTCQNNQIGYTSVGATVPIQTYLVY